jgi:chromosome partitioning protein
MAVICLLNQKGGVGKTSTCHHLSGSLAMGGARVLLIDSDPQSSLTQGFWGPLATRQLDPAETIAAVLGGDEPYPAAVIKPTGVPGIDILPGSKRATSFNVPDPHLVDTGLQFTLRNFLEEVRGAYDYVLIDCPPNLHLCSWVALVSADHLVVPLKPEDYGAQGIIDVQESVDLVLSGPNPGLVPLGYLITMMNVRKSIHKLYEETLRTQFGPLVFDTRMAEAVDYVEALNQRKPVAQYKPRGAAAKTMKALAEELDARLRAARDGVPFESPVVIAREEAA